MTRQRRALVVIGAIALMTSSCGRNSGGAVPTSSVTQETDVLVSEGCGRAADSGTESLTLETTDGRTRTYRLHTPRGYDAAAATPVVLNFHGLASNIVAQVNLSRLEPLADTEGFIVVTPQGTRNANGLPHWNASAATSDNAVDDIQFVHELLDAVESSRCVDLDRMYSTGMSNGGYLSSHLACAMPERIAAVASVTGLIENRDCADDRDVSILHFHGTADPVVDFADIPERVASWAADNGCDLAPIVETISDEVEHQTWSCPENADVEFYIVNGGGHTWPGSPLRRAMSAVLGETTTDIDATAIAWEFFQAHPISPD